MLSKTIILAAAAFGTSASAATAALYAQCGGQGWTGATTCVSGAVCTVSNAYYSQCLPSTNNGAAATTVKTTVNAAATTAKSTSKAAATTVAASSGTTFKASFTEYGAGDTFGSGNCNTATTACGFYTSPGYSAAVSQNEFGVGPGAGAGPACGTCWKLTIQTDSSGNKVSNAGNSIVVQVTNLCPATGNPLCAQNGLTGTNQYGANLNFE